MIFSWNNSSKCVSLEINRNNYHLTKSFIRPWACIFICLGRSSDGKVTQGHLDPWILESMFLLWHCLSTWVSRLMCQFPPLGDVALSWLQAVTDWDSNTSYMSYYSLPCNGWTCGPSHWLESYSFRDGFMATDHLLVTVHRSTAGPTHHRRSWVEFTQTGIILIPCP